ncbi:uncharacterized protein ACA1_139690 [Acanthamoeba castellanii str. Neff]|uniref:Zinc-binding loop region of homing endonuclease domain-containing protein n=1 Tax=Acanthamoeba castellanii (strain ATCC 30010 / Neff) TaxID=1257118 RepID=L8GMM4_ACACF|nr:uncharacterized protein ACA1_139690 [Acanthamoeba castellanii str. Neff]ELR14232.1 hypothetical protein ACA1_139690 [Acanthamoeba castellanii str. Neff]
MMVSHEQQVKTNQVKALVAMANADCLESLHKCWQKQISKRLTLGPGGCWLANYAANKKGEIGYSQVSIKSTKYMAHTISLLLWKRKIDGQLPVSHLCHQSKCVNPQHLIQVLPESLPLSTMFNFTHMHRRLAWPMRSARAAATWQDMGDVCAQYHVCLLMSRVKPQK